MNFTRAVAGMLATGALLLLAGCGSTKDPLPQVTGNHGGLLPGMTLPPAPKSTSLAKPGYSGVINQVQPDGRILASEYINGQLLSQTWFTSLRVPQKALYYISGGIVGGMSEFGPDGKLAKRTYYFVGTSQPERVDEYDGGQVARFTTYWPNGNKRIFSDWDNSPAGPVSRVQEWYVNGYPKSLLQVLVQRNARGEVVEQEKQGRQTEWNDAGYRISDLEFDHDLPVFDYIANKKISR
ncbi:MAG TPA: hypothetical protein VHC95_00205 [Opitutales bacterium]|nr:hypothetical protein [Opitutales bacterium]